MSTLKDLADVRQEILKAELGALLHDLGKLNNIFILHSAEDAPKDSKYHVERIVQPQRAISIKQAETEIQSLAPFDLALKLLSDLDWGTDMTAATSLYAALERRATVGSPPTSAGGIRRWLFTALKDLSKAESALSVLCAVYGACKLHDLLLEAPSSDHRYPYEQLLSDDIEFFLGIQVNIRSRYTLAELITLMWDEFHIRDRKPTATGDSITHERNRIYNEYARQDTLSRWIGKPTFLPRYLITSHGSVRGLEGSGVRKQLKEHVFSTSAYGCEASKVPDLDTLRSELLGKLPAVVDKIKESTAWKDTATAYRELTSLAHTSLSRGLGDTRRPDNDITLQDYSASIAALYKASLAQTILEERVVETHELRWRLLHVSFNGLTFWGQAHHVTDMLGRRRVLEGGLDAVRDILEVQYPLGNEVYRDEHGSVFVVPDATGLLSLQDEHGTALKKLLEDKFDAAGIRGELVPEIDISDPYLGKEIDLAGVLQNRGRENAPQPDVVVRWWSEGQRPENAEICTVCGQRPAGYIEPGLEPWVTSQKAEERNTCGVCLDRRGRRAQDWARNKKGEGENFGPFERTIWTDEVADNNGRFALVVGRFVLDGWLDGKLIPTMLKSPSFARIRRCWDTARQFWLEVQDEVIPDKVGKRLRLGIHSTNAPMIRNALGRWHAYEAEVSGRRLSLCWDPNDEEAADRDLFWTTDNLDYLAGLLGMSVDDLKKRIHRLPLYEPGGYLGQECRADADAEGCQVEREVTFRPYIPLLVKPGTFMALVPADKALAVAKAIRVKYNKEMARVRDRLPLHLGLVFAPRRTPLNTVLEAGRAMLKMPDKWEEWQVETTERRARFSRNGREFEWCYPLKMGDGQTNDIWYPHLLTVDPTDQPELDRDIGHFHLVDDLTGTVFIRPSRFDFEFLDTTARRFEITYQTSEVSANSEVPRRFRRTRPFLLDDLKRLDSLWAELCHLEKSQRHQVIATIEATREAWFGDDRDGQSLTDDVFRRFVHDTLAGAAWPKDHRWKTIPDERRKELVKAGVSGELADLAELHMQILKE